VQGVTAHGGGSTLAAALEEQRERLLPCVHCGFCLPACPTYNRLGDEADSPRGRLHLMKAVVEGRLDAGSDAFTLHIDRCLGCRACEPVCPSGVEYGTLLELARHTASERRPQGALTRVLLSVMASRPLRGALFLGGRILRATGLATLGARVLPSVGGLRSARLGLAMLAATAPWRPAPERVNGPSALDPATRPGAREPSRGAPAPTPCGRVGVLVGCVQAGLYSRINDATVRTLHANGYEVVEVARQDCCGALHAHGGDLDGARSLARVNVDAFLAAGVDQVAVNAAGCGAAMKEYGTLLSSDPAYRERAADFAARVRDVTELLAAAGPRSGAPVECSVAYDHPCHLLHAQRIERAPLDVLAAVPGVEVRVIVRADECCGGAGIYGITHPDLGGRIGRDKVASVRAAAADLVATPNPGCMMQIGAGLRLEGAREGVVHPVELLDESYRRAGMYERTTGAVGS
jgi:glycolate oxidase iron-sulfur subunit